MRITRLFTYVSSESIITDSCQLIFQCGLWAWRMYSVCDHKHVPMIEHTKDGKYKLRNANGKAVLHEEYTDAVKLALEVYEKFKKLNDFFYIQDTRVIFNGV